MLIGGRRPTDAVRGGAWVLAAGVPDEVAVPAALVPGACGTSAVSIDRSLIAPGLRVGSAIGDTGYRIGGARGWIG